MKIIGLGHKKYVGKDTAARFIAMSYRLTFPGSLVVKKGFADKLKDICYQLYSWAGMRSPEYYENNSTEKDEHLILLGKTVRQIWIEVGNKLRDVYSATWLDHLLQGTKADLLIISDLRYLNEANAIKIRGGKCIKITRPDIPITHDIADDALNNYKEWDAEIINDGTIHDFYNNIINTCNQLFDFNLTK